MRQRLRALGTLVLGCGAIIFAAVALIWSFDPVDRASGTVIARSHGECTDVFEDADQVRHTFVEGGGKWGCERDVGSREDIFYDATDPSDASTTGPGRLRFYAAVFAVAGAAWIGSSVVKLRRSDLAPDASVPADDAPRP